MGTQRIAGVILIATFAIMALSLAFASVPGLYETQDIEQRLEIIEANRTKWMAGQAAVFVFGALTIAGYSFLAYSPRIRDLGLLPAIGAGAIVLGTIVGMYFVYMQTIDPRGGYSRVYSTPEDLAYWLWLVGTFVFGIAFLRAGYPKWLGYLTASSAALYGAVFAVTGLGFMAPFIVVVLDLVIGIVLLTAGAQAMEPQQATA